MRIVKYGIIHLALLIFVAHANEGSQNSSKAIFCDLMSWSMYRKGQGKFEISSDFNPFLCTHILYNSLGLDENTNQLKSRDEWADERANGKGLISQLVNIRDLKNPNLKILVSVGGWAEGSKKFSDLVTSTVKIDSFASSVMEFVSRHNLDGIDIHWTFPTDRGGIPEDKINFIGLLKELRRRLSSKSKLLTVQLSPKRYVIDPGYDLPAISKHVDYMNVMNFDYNGPWEKQTGINAPLNSDNELNVVFSIDYLIKRGAVASKLLLGIATFGHCVEMDSEQNDNEYLRVPSNAGYKNRWTGDAGFIGYNEVCYELNTATGWNVYWDQASSTPFAVNGRKFVSYDNEQSIAEKLKLVNSQKLGGVSIWSLDTDDFKAYCQGKPFPLTSFIKDNLGNKQVVQEETTTPPPFNFVGVISHSHG